VSSVVKLKLRNPLGFLCDLLIRRSRLQRWLCSSKYIHYPTTVSTFEITMADMTPLAYSDKLFSALDDVPAQVSYAPRAIAQPRQVPGWFRNGISCITILSDLAFRPPAWPSPFPVWLSQGRVSVMVPSDCGTSVTCHDGDRPKVTSSVSFSFPGQVTQPSWRRLRFVLSETHSGQATLAMVHRELPFKRARDCRCAENLHHDPHLERRASRCFPPLRVLHILGGALANPGPCS
jgi:hypothetical protein